MVRYQGGHNAGHTVKFRDQHFSLQLIPSGILHADMVCVLGNGMVVAPDALLSELGRLYEAGVRFDGRLFISNRAHVLLPCHAQLDKGREEARGAGRIGTTSRGIGPAYESKASRFGLRMVDLFAPDLEERLRVLLSRIQVELTSLGGESLPAPAAYADQCRQWGERLKPSLRDTEQLLNGWIKEGKCLLFEGAQGALLDIDHGTYPFVTLVELDDRRRLHGHRRAADADRRRDGGASRPTPRGSAAAPFPSELTDATGEFLRHRGNEFGTVTGPAAALRLARHRGGPLQPAPQRREHPWR